MYVLVTNLPQIAVISHCQHCTFSQHQSLTWKGPQEIFHLSSFQGKVPKLAVGNCLPTI